MTSTEASGSGIVLDAAVEELDVGGAGLGGVAAGEVEHLVGHVEPVGEAGRADPLGGQQHVDAAARAEVEHGLAGVEVGDGGRVAAAEAGQRGRVGEVAEVVVVGDAPASTRRARSRRPAPESAARAASA